MTEVSQVSDFVDQMLNAGMHRRRMYLKVVVFDNDDFAYARAVHKNRPDLDMFLSVGNATPPLPDNTPPAKADPEVIMDALKKMAWLMEKAAGEYAMRNVRVLPQMHLLAWGNARGR